MKEAELAYLKQDEWAKKAIYNVARVGYFSSDRAIAEYATKIWHISECSDDFVDFEKQEAKSA